MEFHIVVESMPIFALYCTIAIFVIGIVFSLGVTFGMHRLLPEYRRLIEERLGTENDQVLS